MDNDEDDRDKEGNEQHEAEGKTKMLRQNPGTGQKIKGYGFSEDFEKTSFGIFASRICFYSIKDV